MGLETGVGKKWGFERQGWTGERGQTGEGMCLCDFLTLAEPVSSDVKWEN